MRTLVTGHQGLLGSEIFSLLQDPVGISTSDCDLRHDDFADLISPEVKTVIHCAAKVGGVKANSESVADFFDDNIHMNLNVLKGCQRRGVKLVSVLSTCVYPDADYVKYPLTEEQLHLGPPHHSNFGYAYAKRMLEVQSRAYRQQHGCNFVTVIPNNLYGKRDNYHLENGHVIPAMIRKFHESHVRGEDVTLWGSGKPMREFTFATDAAKIVLWIAKHYDGSHPINIGNTEEISIFHLAHKISDLMNFSGKVKFDASKPDGQYKKPSSNQNLRELGWEGSYTPLHEGLQKTIEFFRNNYPHVRGI